jgi:chromosomal replication initiator protein
MVDGIADIPLPGYILQSDREDSDELTPSHFLAGPENRLVEVAVRSVMDGSDPCYSPIVLYGPSGTGKSHVAHGLATVWKTHHRRRRVICSTAVDFAREFADAIESQAIDEFRAKYRAAELLVLEDLGQLITERSGKLSAQEEFIHTLDALSAEGKWVVVTASASPSEMSGLLPSLQSRLMGGLTVAMAPPSLETRQAVLRQLAAMKHITLSDSAATVLAEGLNGTVPELAGALAQLAPPAGLDEDTVDLQSVREFLAEQQSEHPTIHRIALATAKHFRIRLSELRSSVRRRALVTARGVAVYLARNVAGMNLQEIGEYFGGRDHTTVMHSFRKTEELLRTDPTVHEAIETLRRELWKK